MDCATRLVSTQFRHAQRLGDQSLAGEGRVSVQEQAHDLLAVVVIGETLLGAHPPLHHGTDRLQMGGIGRQRKVNGAAVSDLPVRRGAEVVLDITGALHRIGVPGLAVKLREDLGIRLPHDIGEHIEATAVGHAEDDLLDAQVGGAANDGLHGGNGALGALEGKSFGARVLDVEKLLETLGPGDLREHPLLLFRIELGIAARSFELALDPGLLLRTLHVHELNADSAAVRPAHDIKNLFEGRPLQAENTVDEELAAIILLDEPIGPRLEFGMVAVTVEPEGIEVGGEVSTHAIGADHHQDADAVAGKGELGYRFPATRRWRRPGRQRHRNRRFLPAIVVIPHAMMAAGDRQFRTRGRLVAGQIIEDLPPCLADQGPVSGILCVEFLDVVRVVSVEVGDVVSMLVHGVTLPARGAASLSPSLRPAWSFPGWPASRRCGILHASWPRPCRRRRPCHRR